MTDDQLERLIELVKSQPELYDPNHKHYKAVQKKDEIWKDIALACGIKNSALAKRQWKYLCDSYKHTVNRSQSKASAHGVSSATSYTSTFWKFQDALNFLEAYMPRKRETQCNSSNTEQLPWINDKIRVRDRLHNLEYYETEAATQTGGDLISSSSKEKNETTKELSKVKKGRRKGNKTLTRRNPKSSQQTISCSPSTYKTTTPTDPVLYTFYMSLYEATLQMSRRTQMEIKRKLFNLVTDYEENYYSEKSNLPSSSNYILNREETKFSGFRGLGENDDYDDEGSYDENVFEVFNRNESSSVKLSDFQLNAQNRVRTL